MVCIIVALIFGTTFLKSRPGSVNSMNDSFSFMGVMYLDVFFMAIIFYSSAIPNMVSQRDSYYREKASRMYQSAPYAMTFGISEFPYLVAYTLLHCGILWGLVDFFPQDGYGFWYYACYFFLFISLLTYMAQFLAAAMPNQQVASSLGMAYLSMTANVSGFAIRPQDIPGGWMFFYWLAPIHYVLEGLVVTQFHGAKTKVKGAPGFPPGEEPTLSRYYTSHWNDGWFGGYFVWSHRFQNMIILVRFRVEIKQ